MAGSLEEDLQRLREESEGLAREAGMLTKEIETLEAQDETDRLLAEKEELLARFGDGLKEWIVYKLSSDLLEQTIRMYESEKQPKLLARSSEIFSAVTGNSYKKVLFPLDGDRVKVERADGARIEEELLSRGTQEQLYLSMRLAHLDVYHREKFNIPMMMDDVLVNFDHARATSNCRCPGKICRGDRLTNPVLYLSSTHGRPLSRQCYPIPIGTDPGRGRGALTIENHVAVLPRIHGCP